MLDIDRFTRSFAATPSRRDVARALAGLAIAGALGVAVRDGGSAKKTCKPCQRKKRGKCKGRKPDNAACKGTGRCFQGDCIPKPDCQSAGLPGACPTPGPDADCCSGVCSAQNVCQVGGTGSPCLKDSDCITDQATCVAYVCRPIL